MPMPQLPDQADIHPATPPDMAGMMRQSTFASRATREGVLTIDPNAPFFLRHHPKAWRVSRTLPKPLALPDVVMHVLEPGVNGVRTRNQDEDPDMGYRQSVMDSQMRGWIYLDPMAPVPAGCLPEGVPPGSYIRELDCQGPLTRRAGIRYIEAWQVPTATLPDELQSFQFDDHHYELWLKFLVETGQIRPMMASILPAMEDRVRGHLERAEGLNLQPDVRRKWLAKRQAIVDAYEAAEPAAPLFGEDLAAALADYQTAAPSTPKKKGARVK